MKMIRTAFVAAALLCLVKPGHAGLLQEFQKGSTSRSVEITVLDETTGVPTAGLAFNSSGIDLEYCREATACVDITEVTQTVGGAWTSGGFVSKGHGVYRLDVPDAALASGVNSVNIQGTITGYIVVGGTIKLVNYNPEDAVRLGLTALPNANAEAAGGLYTRGTGAGQINQPANGRVDTGVVAWNGTALGTTNPLPNAAPNAAGGLLTFGTSSGQLNPTSGNVTVGTNNDKTGYSLTQAFPTNFSSLAITGGGAVTAGTVSDKTGYALTQSFPTNFASLAITGGGAVTAGTVSDKTGYSLTQAFPANFSLMSLDGSGRVTLAPTTGNCLAPMGCSAQGTLNGTHSSTTADLGSGAPGATSDMVGKTLVIPSKFFSRSITAYDSGTGVATFSTTSLTLANGDQWYLYETAPGGGGLTAGDVWGYTTRVLTAGTNIALAKGTGVTGFNDLSTTQVENAVLNATASSHTTAGTVGQLISRIPNAAPGANGGLPTVNASNQVAGVSGNVAGSVGSVAGSVAGSVGSVTGNVGGNVVGNVNGSVGSLGTTAQTNAQAATAAALNAWTIDGELATDVLCRLVATMYGAAAYDSGDDETVFSNPAGTEVRVTVAYGAEAGDRDLVTLGASCGN